MSLSVAQELIRALGRALAVAAPCLVVGLLTRGGAPPGPLQSVFGGLQLAAVVVSAPALLVLRGLHLTTGNYLSNHGLVALTALNLAFYGALFFHLARRLRRGGLAPERRGLTRREVLVRGAVLVAGTGGMLALARDKENLEVVTRELVLPALPDELVGLRLALITDLHRGPYNGMDYLVAMADRVNAERPDLVLAVGDFVHASGAYFDEAAEVLARLRPRLGLVGTLGNHDHWEGLARARATLGGAGLRLVDNDRLFVTTRRELSAERPDQGLCLAGVGDLWEDRQDLEAALRGVPDAMPRLVLSHNPDFAEDPVPHGLRVDLQLSGHTHGGQVNLPGLGAPVVPSRYGNRYASGLVQGPRWPVYISRGIGTTVLPLRLRVRPEITLFHLRQGPP